MGKKNLPVTDHAVLSWLERVAMVDIEAVRRQIHSETWEALNSGAKRAVVNGTDYRMNGGVVTTVIFGRRNMRPLNWTEGN
ncbi:hypothetical protein RA27_20460 [Ruegeria sp. ANG-R]|uniref:hypothetical protein n=1 Tax=Ruegeria sp. ANG-R TaxID=1577903 RepID=UPI00058000A9|nr:hypothetical protein [Ruegeria sp. ANG-R]KIC38145.1 hypothetical protein RA27_20460 [Ruegeria sp. ANG-R]